MARTVTLTQLRERLDQRADIQGDQHFAVAEKDALLNEGIAYFWDDLVAAAPPHYYLTDAAPFSTTAGVLAYALPADFYKLSRAQVDAGSGRRTTLDEMQPDERGYLVAPGGGESVLLEYIPAATKLVGPGDTFDGVNGWEELVVLWATVRVYAKKQLDPALMVGLLQSEEQRVKKMAQRTLGSPNRVIRSDLRSGPMLPFRGSQLTHYRVRGASIELYRSQWVYA